MAVCRHIVKMFGRSNLAGKFARQINTVRFDQFDQTVQLVRRHEGIYRIAKQNQLRLLKRLAHRGKIFFNLFDTLSHRQECKIMFRVQGLYIQRRVNGGGIWPFGAGV